MGERSDKTTTEFVSTSSPRLGELIYSTQRILKGLILMDNLAVLSHAPRKEYLEPRNFSNVIYAAITTATARLKLLEAMEKTNGQVIYTGNADARCVILF